MKEENPLFKPRPILMSIEYYKTKSYLKSHHTNYKYYISKENYIFYSNYFNHLNKIESKNTKSNIKKIDWCLKLLFTFLDNQSINIEYLSKDNIYTFFSKMYESFSTESVLSIKYIIKDFLNFLYNTGIISFNSDSIILINKINRRSTIKTSFSIDEIKKIFKALNENTKNSKFLYSILSLSSYLGLRIGDIISLKYDDIDFDMNKITIIQNKTKCTVVLPLIDKVKYPLLDYIVNSRTNSINKDYIFSTLKKPYTKFSSGASIYSMIRKVIIESGISIKDRKLGPHSFRHSLATNLLNLGTPIYKISDILGHSSTQSTEVYIEKDFSKLQELSLEVPYVL